MKRRNLAGATAVFGAVAILAAACGGGSSSSSSSKKIDIVAFSTPATAYAKEIPAFQKTAAGKGVSFGQSYGSSGSQARAVVAGTPADVVEFSTLPDMESLVQQQLVASNWDQNAYDGFVTDSVVVLVVRKGNPDHITGWDSLAKPGVKIVTPNPTTSGSARWNIMAAYGSQIEEGKTPAQALSFVSSVLHNTVDQPDSGSDATAAFTSGTGGTGDVLIAYENEAIEAKAAGDAVQYVIPPQTILIQNPVAATTSAHDPTAANSFVKFLYTPTAQKLFQSEGYRPVVKSVFDKSEFPTPKDLFTIAKFGGWDKVVDQFFSTNGSITNIENNLGSGS